MGKHQATKHVNPNALASNAKGDRGAKNSRNAAVESARKSHGLPSQKSPLPND